MRSGLEVNYRYKSINFIGKFNHKINIIFDYSGTGKTLLLKALRSHLSEEGKRVIRYSFEMPLEKVIDDYDVMLLDNADLYLTPELFEDLKLTKALIVISMHRTLGLKLTSEVGRYVCNFDSGTVNVRGW